MEKKLLLLFLFFVTFTSLSQENKTFISGRVLDSLGIVKNANIINLKTNQGTFSFDDGRFKIFVSLGDSVRISTIQHISQKIVINKEVIDNKALIVRLKFNTYILDEFELKRNHLTGSLLADIKQVPTNKKDALLKSNMSFSNVDFSLVDQRIDANNSAKPPKGNTVPNSFSGLNIGGILKSIFTSKKLIKIQETDKKIDQKKEFSTKILSELGEAFFFDKLKTPKENYFHFIEYCAHLDVEQMYDKNKLLEIIVLYQKESILYLKILNKK